MTGLEEIKTLAQKEFPHFIKYVADGLTGALVQNTHFFPMPVRVNFAKAARNAAEKAQFLSELYENSKNVCGIGYTLEIELVSTRSKGNRRVLKRICFATEDDYLAFLIAHGTEGGTTDDCDTEGFNEALFAVMDSGLLQEEELAPWALQHIKELGRYRPDERFWQNICKVARWLKSNRNCNLYIRELPFINSVPPRFIEENKSLIHSLVTRDALKISFEADLGLLGKQTTVRFRSLCKEVPLMLGEQELTELTVPIEDFCGLSKSGILSGIENVFIVETEMVYLTFPECKKSLCILASGYSANILKLCDWLKGVSLFYFGSIKSNSFGMLSSLRGYFEGIASFCMDSATLSSYGECLQREDGGISQGGQLNLTKDEAAVLQELESSPEKKFLSQENISIGYIQKALAQLFPDG